MNGRTPAAHPELLRRKGQRAHCIKRRKQLQGQPRGLNKQWVHAQVMPVRMQYGR